MRPPGVDEERYQWRERSLGGFTGTLSVGERLDLMPIQT
jgi:hypothetical protein